MHHKHFLISDISVSIYFQGTHPDSLYRIPTRTSSASTPTASPSPSVNSTHSRHHHHQTFWKAGSQVPITSTFTHTKRTTFYRFLKIFWRYAKWPIGLLMLCGLLGVVVYFIVIGKWKSVSLCLDLIHLQNFCISHCSITTIS